MDLFGSFKLQRETRPEAAAFLITSGDRSVPISWRQFTDDIAAGAWLIEHYAEGGAIGILGENSYEWMVVHAASLFCGAIAVPLDINLNAEEIVSRLRAVGARALIHSSLYLEKACDVAAMMPALVRTGFGTRAADRFLDKARAALVREGKTIFDRPSIDRSRTSMIVFTSGTTSEPRGAMLTIEGLEAFGSYAEEALSMQTGERSLMLLPLHHIYGIASTYAMLAKGVALGVCPDFRRIYDAVARFRVNYLFLVPALAEILAAKIERHGCSAEEALGSPIDWALIGGAPLPRRTYERLMALGIKAITAYGLTETTALYSIAPVAGDAHVGSAGHAARLPGLETKVSSTGELLIRGPNVMKGYWNMPERTAQAIDAEGWFHTGDLGRIDEDGFVWITGRGSRTIVLSSGKKIAPEELEEKLLSVPGVLEALVSGEGESREVCAEIYASVSEEAVRRGVDALNRSLPVYKRFSRVVVRTTPFPRTSSGKIRLSRSTVAKAPLISLKNDLLLDEHRRAIVLKVLTPVLLVTGIVMCWLSSFLLPYWFYARLHKEVPVEVHEIFMLLQQVGVALSVIALVMGIFLVRRFARRLWRLLRP